MGRPLQALLVALLCCHSLRPQPCAAGILTWAQNVRDTVRTVLGAKDAAKELLASASGGDGDLATPQELFRASKNLIGGYPLVSLFDTIHNFCSEAITSKYLQVRITPNIEQLQFQLRTACNKYSYPLLQAEQMWRSPEFDPQKKLVILATGWTTTVNNSDTIDVLAQAYNCRGDVNFIAVDAAHYVDTLYTWSALNTDVIGYHLGVGLARLRALVPARRIHLIGHSLGAHIVGAAARHFRQLTGDTLPHITGLDPANPCFNDGEQLSGLQQDDAAFVDVLHSNPGVLGKAAPLGDLDVYLSGMDPLPAGCLSIVCAHDRSWQLYADSVFPGNERKFLATSCYTQRRRANGGDDDDDDDDDYDDCAPGDAQAIGYAASHRLSGSFYLRRQVQVATFGKNASAVFAGRKCGQCRQ